MGGRKGIEWHIVPTVGQHFNGKAKRMIGILKKQMWRSSKGRKYTHDTARGCTSSQQPAAGHRYMGRRQPPMSRRFDDGKNQRRNANPLVQDRAAAGEEVQGSPGSQGGILG
jgi:hypothetical protein